ELRPQFEDVPVAAPEHAHRRAPIVGRDRAIFVGEQPDEDGFAGAVGTNDGGVFAGVDRQRDTVEYAAPVLLDGCGDELEDRLGVHTGSGWPFVSSPKGSRTSPSRNAIDVSATGTPRVLKWPMPAPTRNTIAQPTKRPIELVNPIALPRHSVVYCSGIHSVYIAKFAPPRPRRNTIAKNVGSAFGVM